MSGKIYQGEHLTIPFPQDGTLKGLEIQGKTAQENTSESYLSAEGKHIIIDKQLAGGINLFGARNGFAINKGVTMELKNYNNLIFKLHIKDKRCILLL